LSNIDDDIDVDGQPLGIGQQQSQRCPAFEYESKATSLEKFEESQCANEFFSEDRVNAVLLADSLYMFNLKRMFRDHSDTS
jgi:hypothetical protein